MAERGALQTERLIGRTLGDFVVGPQIGEGGAGAVYRGEQRALRRPVVIKVMRLDAGEQAHLQRFTREAQLASELDHPYGAHIYAFGAEPDGIMWIAMELVRGTPLDQLIAAQGPMPLERFAPLLHRLCEVVHAAHERSIVHRDIKPANVMVLMRSGMLLPKLLDFGIAKQVGETSAPARLPSGEQPALDPGITQAGAIVGSPRYMAPEQWLNQDVGPAVDQYALGALAYEALTGHPPFTGATMAAIARAHAQQPMPSLGAAFPAALTEVLRKATAKRAADRYPSVIEFAEAFRAATGIGEAELDLPRLNEAVRAALLQDAPQPLAEAVAAVDAVRSIHQARDALWQIVTVAARLVGTYAIAARGRIGGELSRSAGGLLRALHTRRLDDQEWIALAEELVQPFAGRAQVHPLPELVELYFDDAGERRAPFGTIFALRDEAGAGSTSDERIVREHLARAVVEVDALLRRLSFLTSYPLVVVGPRRAERWTGVRRPSRLPIALHGPVVPDGGVCVVDAGGTPLLELRPLVQAAPPSAGAAAELFLLDGPGRAGARLLALPGRFERSDDRLWDWLSDTLLGGAQAAGASSAEARAPYLGLATFQRTDAALFVGRERETDAALNRLRVQPFLAIVGASGAGKSSFVHAGVLPGLEGDPVVVQTRPGRAPLEALMAQLEHAGVPTDGLVDAVRADVAALGRTLRAWAAGRGHTLVLVVDQLEELFTLGASLEERSLYARALSVAVRGVDDPLRLIVTLRDDFLGAAQGIIELRERLRGGLELLATPGPADLLRILVEPARRAGYAFEDAELPQQMVAAVADARGALPLLSFCAAQLWEIRDRHWKQLTRRGHDALGGVAGALARHAESMVRALPPESQRLVREAFRHLVTADGTRAALTRRELVEVLGSDAAAEGCVETLVASRLVVISEDGTGSRIEVAHEALLHAWPRLVAWRREDAEGSQLRDQLRSTVRQWEERGRPRGLLWRDDALAEYRLWRLRHPQPLTTAEEEFARRSVAQASRGRRVRTGIISAAFLGLIAVLITVVQLQRRTDVERRRADERLAMFHEEQGRQLVLAGEPMKALVHLDEARRMGRSEPALHYLIARAISAFDGEERVLHAHKGPSRIRVSPDRRRALTMDSEGRAWITSFEGGTPPRALVGHHGEITEGAWSNDGARVVTAGVDGIVRVWDAESGRVLVETPRRPEPYHSLALVAGGATVITAAADGAILLWDTATGRLTATLRPSGSRVLEVRSDGSGHRAISSSTDGKVQVWNVDAHALLRSLDAGSNANLVAISRDGERAAVASSDGLRIWRIGSTAPPRLFDLSSAEPTRIEFIGDSPLLLSVTDAQVRLWDTDSGRSVCTLVSSRGSFNSAAVSTDRSLLATAGSDGLVRLWRVHTALEIDHFAGHTDRVAAVRFIAGDRLISAGYDGTLRIWHPGRGHSPTAFDLRGRIVAGGVAADGGLIAVNEAGGLFSGDRDKPPSLSAELPLAGLSAPFTISADGTRVVGVFGGNKVLLWRADGARAGELALPGSTVTAAMSLGGDRVVIGREDGAIEWWALGGEAPLARSRIGKTGDPVVLLRASADGQRIVAGDGPQLDLWRGIGGPALHLIGHSAMVNDAAFDHDERALASVSDDGTAKLWDLGSGRLLRTLDTTDGADTVVFDRSDRVIVIGTDTGAVQWWDRSSGRLVAVDRGHNAAVVFLGALGDVMYSGAHDGRLIRWPVILEHYDSARLHELLQCRVAFRLIGEALVPFAPTLCAQDVQL